MLAIATLIVAGTLTTLTVTAAEPSAGALRATELRTAVTIVPAESSLIGIIDAFERAARRLVLRTKDARVTFVLAADAVVRLGSRTLPPDELGAQKGRRAKVRFTLTNGSRTAHWVVISTERD